MMSVSRKVVTKRRPFVSEPESSSSRVSITSINSYSLLPSVRVIRGSRVTFVALLVLVAAASYGVLKYWFVVSGVYYDTLEKVQGCVPRNLELVNEMLDAEYDSYMKDEVCDSHILDQNGFAARRTDAMKPTSSSSSSSSSHTGQTRTSTSTGTSGATGRQSWRSKIDTEQQQQIDRMKKSLPKVYIYEPQIDLLVAHMNFLETGNGGGAGEMGDGGGEGGINADENGVSIIEDEDDDLSKKDKGRPCEVFLFHDLLKRNITGTLVNTLEEADRYAKCGVPIIVWRRVSPAVVARQFNHNTQSHTSMVLLDCPLSLMCTDVPPLSLWTSENENVNAWMDRIYVPFAYQCKVESGIEWYRSSGIDRLYKELKRSEIGLQNRMHDVFIYSHRHYTQRTGEPVDQFSDHEALTHS